MARPAGIWRAFVVVALFGLTLVGPGRAQESSQLAASMTALQSAAPGVTWDSNSRVVGDVTCDGRVDVVMVGHQGGTVWIGLVPGSTPPGVGEPTVGSFAVGRESPESFCRLPVRLQLHRLECENEDGPLPGCKPVAGCLGFTAQDDACDGFHFFWNSERATITWWRR